MKVKNLPATVSTKDKLDVISGLEKKMNKLLTSAVILNSLTVTHVQVVIIL